MGAVACRPGVGIVVPSALALLSACVSGASPETRRPSAADYLSEEAFPGLHIIECVGGGSSLLLYKWGQDPKPAGRKPLEATTSHWETWQEARLDIERLLDIPKPEPLQLPWAIFDVQGRPVRSVSALERLPMAFVLEIGQWMWPAVRIGFEQRIEEVNKDSAAILRTLSLRPVIFEVRNFIAKHEAMKVMKIGRAQGLHSSQGVLQSADVQKKTQHSKFRTSTQAWLHNYQSPIIAELDERVANLTRIPASHNEPVQLLRYGEDQYYHGHMDWSELELYPDQRHVWLSSHFGHQDRLATVFWYLNDVQEGGETIFPKHGQPICSFETRGGLDTRHCRGARDPDMASCEQGLKVRPRQGTVILWYNFHPNGRGDRNALHAGCPVGRNLTKWSGNKWVRIKPLDATARWIEDHPAMVRHGWAGGKKAAADPLKCSIDFTNHAGRGVDVMWYNPNKRSYDKLLGLAAGQTVSQLSYQGHQFKLRAGERWSGLATCQSPAIKFVLTSDFRVRRHDEVEEL